MGNYVGCAAAPKAPLHTSSTQMHLSMTSFAVDSHINLSMSSTEGGVITINSASPEEIKAFLLSDRAYFTVALPEYFSFHPLSEAAYQLVPDDLVSLSDNILQDCRKVKANYVIYGNKDGKYAWRAYELIHPVLYALLVKIIVAHVDEIKNKLTSESDKIKCMSLPSWNEKDIVRPSATMIERWWEGIELESIAALLYK